MARRREMTDFVDGVKLRGLLWSLYRQFLALFVGPAPKGPVGGRKRDRRNLWVLFRSSWDN